MEIRAQIIIVFDQAQQKR